MTWPPKVSEVRLTCGVLGFSAQAFCAWSTNPFTLRDQEDAYASIALIDAHSDDPALGYRSRLMCSSGPSSRPENTVRGDPRSQQRLWSTIAKKGRKGKRPGPAGER